MGKPLNWGLIGTGISRAFAEAIPQSPDARLHSVLSRREDTARAFADRHGIPHAHTDLEAFASDPDLDVVLVGSPHPFHKAQTIACLEAGKHVLCEKPMALNRGEVEEMIAAAQVHNRFLMEAMWMYFIPAVKHAKELIGSGAIGTPCLIAADFGSVIPVDHENRFYDPALGGGALLDMGIYPLSFAYLMFGKPDRITGTAIVGGTGVDEQIAVALQFVDGRMANLTASIRADSPCEAVVAGTEGHLRVHRKFWYSEKLSVSLRDGSVREIDMPLNGSGYRYEIDHVNACIRAGRLESDVMPWATSLDLVIMMDRLRADWGVRYPQES